MKKNIKTKNGKKTYKRFITALSLTLISVVIICAAFLLIFGGRIQAAQKESASKIASINDNTFKRKSPTIIYDKDGNEITGLSSPGYIYTEYGNIPNLVKEAFVATEDKDFFKNNGISLRGIGRALFSYVKNLGKVTQGGSTITQQLVKNVLLTQDRTWSRKLTEAFIAVQLEKMYTKEQILEYYLNDINFSNGANSIASAAHMYFNKPLDELNLAEITFLAAIPNNPTYYNPLKYYDHVTVRQHLMLYNLKAQNYITEKQYQDALNTKVVLNYQPIKGKTESFVTSYAIDSAVKALMQKDNFDFQYQFSSDKDRSDYLDNYNEIYSDYENKLMKGGYKIYTSLDQSLQKELQASLDKGLKNFKDVDPKTGLYKMQGAAVCIDNSTGEVVAEVGGRSQDNMTNYFNRAFKAVRQPGSAIKPVLVYAPGFDQGYAPDDTMIDQYIPNGPKNDENTFFGKVTLRYATELSLNTVAYQLLQKETTQYALPYLYKMDFNHIVNGDSNPIISIGGFTYGVTPVELAGAYSTLARGGEFIEPTCVSKITDETNNIIYENPKRKTRVYQEDSAYYMTDVLKGVLTKTWATGYGLGLKNMPAAGKTGTTSSCKDGWFAGYTPYYTTVVWTGYDIPTTIKNLYGATYPGSIWKNFMSKANEGLEYRDFAVPSDIQAQITQKADSATQPSESNTDNTSSTATDSLSTDPQGQTGNNNETGSEGTSNSNSTDNTGAGNSTDSTSEGSNINNSNNNAASTATQQT